MKRFLSLILLLCMLFCFCACVSTEPDGCQFYYLRLSDQFVYGKSDGVMAAEKRELSPTITDLNYLLRLYLNGPISDSLETPFPKGTYLLNTQQDGDTLTVVLSSEYAALDGIHQTLAGACLSTTCFELTDAQTICIRSSSKTYTYTRDSFLYLDSTAAPAP